MSRCRCDPVTAAGCQCSFIDSDSINITGSGSAANPIQATLKFNANPDNLAQDTPTGFLVLMPDRFVIPTMRKVISVGTVSLNANDPIPFDSVIYDDYGMSLNNTEAQAPFDAKWRFTVFTRFDNNDGNFNTVRFELDTGSGYSIFSGAREQRDVAVVHETWLLASDEFDLAAGDKVRVTIGENATGAVDIPQASFVMSFVSL